MEMEDQNFWVHVSKSVVAVEHIQYIPHNKVSVGCVLYKSATDTFILTNSIDMDDTFTLKVHFSDAVVLDAEILESNGHFSVLYTTMHENSTTINLRNESLDSFSEVLCVVPKSNLMFQKIKSQIVMPSCTSKDKRGEMVEKTKDCFLIVCYYEDMKIMKSAPVFHRNNEVVGFVLADCTTEDHPNLDQHIKICEKSYVVEEWLRSQFDGDWKVGLEKHLQCLKLKKPSKEGPSKKSHIPAKRRRRL